MNTITAAARSQSRPQHTLLVRGGLRQHGVERDDERHVERVDEPEEHLTVRPAEDAELVLDQHDVEGVGDKGGRSVARPALLLDDRPDVRARCMWSPGFVARHHGCHYGALDLGNRRDRVHDVSGERGNSAESGRVGTNDEGVHARSIPAAFAGKTVTSPRADASGSSP